MVAVYAGTLVSLAGVIAVITLVQGRIPTPQLVSVAVPGQVMGLVNTSVALVVLLAVQPSLWALVPIAVLLGLLGHRLSPLHRLRPAEPDAHRDLRPDPGHLRHPPRRHAARHPARPGAPAAAGRVRHAVAARAGPASRGPAQRPRRRHGPARRGRRPGHPAAAGGGDRRDGGGRASSSATTSCARSCASRASRTRSWCRCEPARRSSARSRWPAGSATSATSARPTCACWRRSPRTPRWRWRTPGWSTGCASTPTTTRSPGCPTGGASCRRSRRRSGCARPARSSRS